MAGSDKEDGDDGRSVYSVDSLPSDSGSSSDTGVASAGDEQSPASSTGPISPRSPISAPASPASFRTASNSPRSPRPPVTPTSAESTHSSGPRSSLASHSGSSSYPSPGSPLGSASSAASHSVLSTAVSTRSSLTWSTASSGKMADTSSARSRKKVAKKGKALAESDAGSTRSSPVSPGSSTSSSSYPIASRSSRTPSQELIRYGSLYLVPALLAIPLGLLIHLTTLLLTPLYNSLPLSLHSHMLYALLAVPPAMAYALLTLRSSAQEVISARVCLTIMTIAGDLIVVAGRRMGSLTGAILGAEFGALAARALLDVAAVGGAIAFALLCADHALPIHHEGSNTGQLLNVVNVMARAGAYALHLFFAEQGWAKLLGNGSSFLVQHPEKTIFFLSLLLTALSLFVRAPKTSPASFASSTHRFLTGSLSLTPKSSRRLKEVTAFLPRSISPILLLLRLPLLILAVRQQIFLRPTPPYYSANGTTRVLRSEKSITGQIVVAEHLTRGYRFLRCDASLLGGRWMRPGSDSRDFDLGDSIFATFALQEIGVLAYRSDESESLARTISMTTELQLEAETGDDEIEKPQERALIIGLGVGISASAMSKRGMALDAIDPAVYHAARDYFNATLPEGSTTISLIPGQDYVSQVAQIQEQMNGTMQKWSYVIHDCFSAGKLPAEVFALEFWKELTGLVEVDGIVAVNVAGVLHSLATKRIILTLLRTFTQCRAFGELGDEEERDDLMNVVVLCTMAHSPLLTFRPPTRHDVLRSPLRSHVYRTFHDKEISLSDLFTDVDLADDGLLITRNGSDDGLTQAAAGLATWKNMQNLLTRDMWLAW